MDLNKKVQDLNGKDLQGEGTRLRDFMAQILVAEKSSDNMRSFLLARDLKEEKEDLNASDIDFIKAAVKKSENFTPLVLGQILLELDEKK